MEHIYVGIGYIPLLGVDRGWVNNKFHRLGHKITLYYDLDFKKVEKLLKSMEIRVWNWRFFDRI